MGSVGDPRNRAGACRGVPRAWSASGPATRRLDPNLLSVGLAELAVTAGCRALMLQERRAARDECVLLSCLCLGVRAVVLCLRRRDERRGFGSLISIFVPAIHSCQYFHSGMYLVFSLFLSSSAMLSSIFPV